MRDHGDYLTYIHERCRCRRCTTAWNVYNQRVKLRHLSGETVSVDRAVVRDHIRRLMSRYGATSQGIARAAGYGNNSVVKAALDTTKTRPVPATAARRILAVDYDTLPDDALVASRLAHEQIERCRAAGASNAAIGRSLGWSGWPGDGWPKERLQVGLVRRLQAFADELESRCEDCDRPAWQDGRWCWDHFKARAKAPVATGCGTDAGYTRHRREGTEPCQACREGHTLAAQLRRAS